MAVVYDHLSQTSDDAEIMRSTSSLDRGKLFEVYKFKLLVTRNGPAKCLVAYYKEEGLSFFSFMPWKYQDMSNDRFEQLNSDIAQNRSSSICFYGKLGLAHIVEIHKFGSEVNHALLDKISKMEAKLAIHCRADIPRTAERISRSENSHGTQVAAPESHSEAI